MRIFALTMLVLSLMPARASAASIAPAVVRNTLAAYVKAHPYGVVALGIIDHGVQTVTLVRGSQAKGLLNEQTQFQIGSITKLFTATALAQMVDAGQLKLGDSIQPYLPAGVSAPTYNAQPITLLSLATHMSGLPGDPPKNATVQSPGDYSIKMLDEALGTTKLTRAPGSKWEYSNFGYAVLGQILANQAHSSYDDLIMHQILDPLAMNDTVVTGSAATRHRMAPAFEYGGAPTQPEPLGAIAPAGSIESDLKDMLTFLSANLEAPRGPLGRELALAQQQQTVVPEYNMAMALGWSIVLPATHHASGDLGDLPPGWLEKGGNTDGYSSLIALSHASNSGIVAMTNVNDDDFQQVIAHAVSPQTARMPVLWATVKREPSPLSGMYVIQEGKHSTLEIFKYSGELYGWIRSATTPSKLTLLGKNRYSWDALQLRLTFNVNRSGQATSLTVVQGSKTLHAKKSSP